MRTGGPNLPGGYGAIVGQAQWAEEHGFKGVWVGEGRLVTNAIVPITLIASNTKRIKVGSGILPYRTRNAALMAVTCIVYAGAGDYIAQIMWQHIFRIHPVPRPPTSCCTSCVIV